MDWPSTKAQGRDASFYGEACNVCAELAREYHQDFERTLNLPMKCLLQFLKEIRLEKRGESAVGNPSDLVKADFLRRYREDLQKKGGNS